MDLPKRKSPRIKHYDYGMPNYYFITICTHERNCCFGNGSEQNALGKIAQTCMQSVSEIYPGVTVEKFVVMPNHVHAILILDKENPYNISQIIGQYKMTVTKRIHKICPGLVVWQRSFHDHIIRNQSSYEKIWMYIEDNPRKWKEDCFYRDDS